jgi:hypothetical protein
MIVPLPKITSAPSAARAVLVADIAAIAAPAAAAPPINRRRLAVVCKSSVLTLLAISEIAHMWHNGSDSRWQFKFGNVLVDAANALTGPAFPFSPHSPR